MLGTGVRAFNSRYKVSAYKPKPSILQCFRCQSYNHIAAVCKSPLKCSKCSLEHDTKSCTANNLKCANCNGEHRASSFACPEYAKQMDKREVSKLSLSAKSVKPGNPTETLRLACSIAAAVVKVVQSRLNLQVSPLEVCHDVANCISRFYRSDLKGEHVHGLAFRADNTEAATTSHNG